MPTPAPTYLHLGSTIETAGLPASRRRQENDCWEALPQLPLPGSVRQRSPELSARLGSSSAKHGSPSLPLRATSARCDRLPQSRPECPAPSSTTLRLPPPTLMRSPSPKSSGASSSVLPRAVFASPRGAIEPRHCGGGAAVRKSIEKEARVVVVLFQRLWGATPSTARRSGGTCKARIGNVKHKDVLIIPIDTSPIPAWLKGTVIRVGRRADEQRRDRRDRRRCRDRRRSRQSA